MHKPIVTYFPIPISMEKYRYFTLIVFAFFLLNQSRYCFSQIPLIQQQNSLGLFGLNLPDQQNHSPKTKFDNLVSINPVSNNQAGFSNQSQVYNIPSTGISPDQARAYADEDIRRHNQKLEQQKNDIQQAERVLDELHIEYELPFENIASKKSYGIAFEELRKMLTGERQINLARAVFISEQAYDPSLSFTDFDNQLNKAANVIGLKMKQDKIPVADNLGKVMTTFRYMADTLKVKSNQESIITTYPKSYDFQDFWGRQDYRKMFVSKLLKEGSGQCHSLPLLFLLLCEKIGANANLAFAPNHSFVKFKDNRGNWHNLELTNGMLASDHFMIESGYIKVEAMQSKIYLEPLSQKQVIVQCLNDLALGYQRKYGYDPFVKHCTDEALRHDPKSLTALQTRANYYITLSNFVAYQYKVKGLSKIQFYEDKDAQEIIALTKKSMRKIEDLGYAEMPQEAYEAWLNSCQKESFKQQHNKEVKILGNMIELKK